MPRPDTDATQDAPTRADAHPAQTGGAIPTTADAAPAAATRRSPEAILDGAIAAVAAAESPGASTALTSAEDQAWLDARRERARALVRGGKRSYRAMAGWDRVRSEDDWAATLERTLQDWESGATVLEMLGGARFIEPERAALLQLLWAQFVAAHRPRSPGEYLAIAMALLAFDQHLRLTQLAHNLEARLETAFFGHDALRVEPGTSEGPHRVGGLAVEALVRRLGQDLLPLLDRTNRTVLRNLQALRQLATPALAMTVANFGQMNIAREQTNQAAVPSESATPSAMLSSPSPIRRQARSNNAMRKD